MLRRVVPALGVLALIPAAGAQEIAKGIFLNGYSDNILTVTHQSNGSDLSSTTQPNQDGYNGIDFSSAAKLAVGWNVTEALSAKVGVKAANVADENFALDESYFTVDLGKGWGAQAGKYVSHVGWVSYEPTGLYRINGGIVPGAFYTVNVTGANVSYASKEVPVSGSVHVVNGFYNIGSTNGAGTGNAGRTGTDLGYGVDATYTLPDDKGNVNVELAYDPAGSPASTGAEKKKALELGANATIKPITDWTFGAELIYLSQESASASVDSPKSDKNNLGAILMANYKLTDSKPFPAYVTGMWQMVESDMGNSDTKTTVNEFSLALLTNPLGSSNFGLNYEVRLLKDDADLPAGAKPVDDGEIDVFVEGLVVIP